MTGSLLHSLPAIVAAAREEANALQADGSESLVDRELVTDDDGQRATEPITANLSRLVLGDNLRAAAALVARGERAQLVYLDPPFDSKAQYTARLDLPGGRVIDQFAYTDTWAQGTATYLAMLAPRLALARELLAPGGSLFVHLDHRVGHYVRLILDELFGRGAFVNEIVWQGAIGDTSAKNRKFIKSHDVLYLYRRPGGEPVWNDVFQPYGAASDKLYHRSDEHGRYRLAPVDNPGGGGYVYDLGLGEKPPRNGYRMPEPTARRWLEEGTLVVESGRVPGRKLHRSPDGVRCRDVWNDIPSLQGAESVGYATQKPVRLLERIVAASTNPSDLVVDLFAGSGTTAIAAERLGRRWVAVDAGLPAALAIRRRLAAEPEARPFVVGTVGPDVPAPAALRATATHADGRLSVKLTGYDPPPLARAAAADAPLALLDQWTVDPAYDGTLLRGAWQAWREGEPPHVPTQAVLPAEPASGPVCVRALDVFGHETRVVLD